MAVVDLSPLAEGNYTAWTLGAGPSKAAACTTNDGNTGYISSPSETSVQSFTLTNKPIDIVSVNTVKIFASIQSADSRVDDDIFARLGGTDGAVVNSENTSAPGYTAVGPTTCPRPGGGSFTPSDIASSGLEVCIRDNDSTTWAVGNRCSFLGLELNYEISKPGMIFMFLSLAIGAAPLLRDLPAMAQALYARTGTRFRRDELEIAWQALREFRHPRIFDLGRVS